VLAQLRDVKSLQVSDGEGVTAAAPRAHTSPVPAQASERRHVLVAQPRKLVCGQRAEEGRAICAHELDALRGSVAFGGHGGQLREETVAAHADANANARALLHVLAEVGRERAACGEAPVAQVGAVNVAFVHGGALQHKLCPCRLLRTLACTGLHEGVDAVEHGPARGLHKILKSECPSIKQILQSTFENVRLVGLVGHARARPLAPVRMEQATVGSELAPHLGGRLVLLHASGFGRRVGADHVVVLDQRARPPVDFRCNAGVAARVHLQEELVAVDVQHHPCRRLVHPLRPLRVRIPREVGQRAESLRFFGSLRWSHSNMNEATPSWLKSFAARKKPKLEGQAVAGVDVSAVTCYMAEELLQCMERYPNGGSAHRSDFVGTRLDSVSRLVRCRR